jgi:Tfp pilus assembly protein PilV
VNTSRHRQRGVSLIEALVAFGVMAFGMMAVVGMQATLRGNGDLARQRAEAVRIAQDAIEAGRGFTVLAATANRTSYAELDSETTSVPGENAEYTLARQVSLEPAVSGTVAAQRRTLAVDVSWEDRNGQTQSVKLASVVSGLEPALAASLVTASNPDPVLAPRGRHRAIPPSAVPVMVQGVSRSGYVPPGQGSEGGTRVAWVFNNATGEITLCSTTGVVTSDLLFSGNAPNCGTTKALLLTGAVRFATDGNPADSPTSMADPTGPETAFAVQVNQALPDSSLSTVSCFKQAAINNEVQYYCAVPIFPDAANWSGALAFVSPLALASPTSSTSASQYRVCRYHEAASYTNVSSAKLSQNYAIIKAGNGSGVAYSCPTASTFVPRTWLHQPV